GIRDFHVTGVQTCALPIYGKIKLANILWLPLTAKGECFGVVELASDTEFEEVDLEFFQDACKLITLEILAAKSRQRIQMLLEERSEERRVGKECRSRWTT